MEELQKAILLSKKDISTIAAEAKVSRQTVYNVLKGKDTYLRTIKRLCKAVGIDYKKIVLRGR